MQEWRSCLLCLHSSGDPTQPVAESKDTAATGRRSNGHCCTVYSVGQSIDDTDNRNCVVDVRTAAVKNEIPTDLVYLHTRHERRKLSSPVSIQTQSLACVRCVRCVNENRKKRIFTQQTQAPPNRNDRSKQWQPTMIGCLPTQALAFLAVFVYATHAAYTTHTRKRLRLNGRLQLLLRVSNVSQRSSYFDHKQ